jgi:hypothetical protein
MHWATQGLQVLFLFLGNARGNVTNVVLNLGLIHELASGLPTMK